MSADPGDCRTFEHFDHEMYLFTDVDTDEPEHLRCERCGVMWTVGPRVPIVPPATCRFCAPVIGETFDPRDQHRECALRAVVGGIGHLTDHSFWCICMGDPDAGLTYRESAIRVAEWVAEHGTDAAFDGATGGDDT